MKPQAKTQDMAQKEVEDALKTAEATNPSMAKGMDVDEVLKKFSNSSAVAAIIGTRSSSSHLRSRSRYST